MQDYINYRRWKTDKNDGRDVLLSVEVLRYEDSGYLSMPKQIRNIGTK